MSSKRPIFFSHATEDKAVVEQIAARVEATLSAELGSLHAWIDGYEIVAGSRLVDSIGEAIDSAEKFFLFVSDTSLSKEWVKQEFQDALSQEISGAKPGFVVPVRLTQSAEFAPFVRGKKYIDVATLTEAQWLQEFRAVLLGHFDARPQMKPNVLMRVAPGSSKNIVDVTFEPAFFAIEQRVVIFAHQPIVNVTRSTRPDAVWLRNNGSSKVYSFLPATAYRFESHGSDLRPGESLTFGVEFATPVGVDVIDRERTGPLSTP